MRVVALYSFNGGKEQVEKYYQKELTEIYEVIQGVNAEEHKVKESKEKTMLGRMLYSPLGLNVAFAREFKPRNWAKYRGWSDYDLSQKRIKKYLAVTWCARSPAALE